MPSDQVILASAAAVMIFIAAALYLRRKRNKKMENCCNYPSGYLGWPLIGELFSFTKPFPVPTLGAFLEHRLSRFGKIFSTNILGKQMVMSADPELNRFVLQNEMRLFESYWPPHFVKLLGEAHVSLQTAGCAHKKLRSVIVGFFSNSRLQTEFIRDANEVARRVVGSWENGSVISAADAVDQYVFSVIAKVTLSMKPGESDTEKMRGYFETYLDGFFSIPLNLPGTLFNRSLQARDMVQKMVKQMIEERMRAEGSEKSEANDFLEWTMKTPSLSWKEIGDLVLAVLFGGTETSRQFICLIIHFLQGSKKALEQLREEHLQAVKEDGLLELTWNNYKHMTFTQCVINEALRLGPGFLPKKAAADFQFKGYDIPRGSIIFLLYSAVHLDPSLFIDPTAFNPWRWLNKYDIKKQTNNLMPFGGGPRLCPGAELARLEITVFLHHFILRYDWRSVEGNIKPIADPRLKFPNGLRIRVEALSNKTI